MTAAAAYPAPAVDLLAGSTLLLGLGALAVGLASAPVHRQRAAELAVLATLIWLCAALVPLPRALGAPSGRAPQRDGVAPSSQVRPAARGEADERTTAREPLRAPGRSRIQSTGASAARPEAGPEPRADASADAKSVTGVDGRPGAAPNDATSPAWPGVSAVRWLTAAHGAGTLFVAAYVLLGFLFVRRLIGATVGPPSWLAMLFERRARALNVRRARLRVGRSHRRPLTAGLFRPVVVLPEELVRPGRASELRRVIDHELVHVRRGDVLGRILFAIAAPLLWVHPLFWWLRARAALAAELIADDGAAGADRAGYARDLLVLAGEMQTLRPVPGTAPGTFRNRSELTRRIDMLISRHDSLAGACSARRRVLQAIVLIVALGGSVSAFGARPLPARAQTANATAGGRIADTNAPDRVEPGQDASAGDAAHGVAPGASSPPAATAMRTGAEAAAGPTAGTEGAGAGPVGTASPRPEENGMPAGYDDDTALRARQASLLGDSRFPARQSAQEPDPGYAATLALVERALSLESDLALAQAELASLERAHATVRAGTGGTVDEFAVQRAQIMLQGVQRRLEAVRILVETEIEATKLEIVQLDQAIRLGTEGPEARPRQLRLNARLKVLERVL